MKYFTPFIVKCQVAAVKNPYLALVFLIFLVIRWHWFWHVSVRDWIPFTAGARSLSDIAVIHCLSWTNSIKLSFHFSYSNVVFFASKGSPLFQIFICVRQEKQQGYYQLLKCRGKYGTFWKLASTTRRQWWWRKVQFMRSILSCWSDVFFY
jgi:hypothetical protein